MSVLLPSKLATKGDVGLSDVDNTSDANKPVSGPQAAAIAAARLLSGSGSPSNGIGANTQFYVDTVGQRLYGPKVNGAWPLEFFDLSVQVVTGSPGAAPTNTALPVITPATAQVGVALTCSPGTWTGSPTLSYQWYYADTQQPINAATSPNYTPTPNEVGHQLLCSVTATNQVASISRLTAFTATVLAAVTTQPVAATAGATISGAASIGSTLTASNGSWTGAPAPTFTYQWLWGDANAPIAGATASTYVVQASDYAHTIKVAVTATNGVGSPGTITSAPTAAIPGVAPVNTSQPVMSNLTPVVGQTIDANPGVWSGIPAPTFTYRWYYGDTSTLIAGATGASYTPTLADVGHQLNVTVVATNLISAASADSPTWTSPVESNVTGQNVAPTPAASPVISGTAQVGLTLSVSNGSWNGSPPPSFTYQWYRADSNALIVGATDQNYAPVSGDVGHTLKAAVTATNSAGSQAAFTVATSAVLAADTNIIAPILVAAPVISGATQEAGTLSTALATWSETPIAPPTNTALPVISGQKVEGQTLSATTGTWTGSPLSYAYQWKRNGTNIGSATASTYVLAAADIGTTITVSVIASNGGGAGTAAVSAGYSPISAAAPLNTALPTISGTHAVGDTLTVSNGTWTSSQAITYSYQWTRDAANIPNATAATYVIVSGDNAHTLACAVTAANSGGPRTVTASGVAIGGGGAAVTWNPSDTSPHIILSGGNLVATSDGTDANYQARATVGKTIGKWYWEVTNGGTITDDNTSWGAAISGGPFDTWLGSDAASVGLTQNGVSQARIYYQYDTVGAPASVNMAIAGGDTIAHALDLDNGKIWFRVWNGSTWSNWNGSGTDSPATNTGGKVIPTGVSTTWRPAVAPYIGESETANFGATSFIGTPPSGFSAIG